MLCCTEWDAEYIIMQAGWSVLNAKHQEISVSLYQLKNIYTSVYRPLKKWLIKLTRRCGLICLLVTWVCNTILGALSFRWCSLKREGILEGSPYAIIWSFLASDPYPKAAFFFFFLFLF